MNRNVLFAIAVAVVILVVSRLPQDVFATMQAILVLASGALLLGLAAAVVLAPARRLLGRLFGFAVDAAPALSVAREEDWRQLGRPLATALVLLAVAGVPALLR